jgi:hypothetical protein
MGFGDGRRDILIILGWEPMEPMSGFGYLIIGTLQRRKRGTHLAALCNSTNLPVGIFPIPFLFNSLAPCSLGNAPLFSFQLVRIAHIPG